MRFLTFIQLAFGLVASDCIHGFLYRDPDNCNGFLQCSFQKLHPINCPDGLVFSSAHQMCVHEQLAPCNAPAEMTTTEMEPRTSTSHPTQERPSEFPFIQWLTGKCVHIYCSACDVVLIHTCLSVLYFHCLWHIAPL